MQKGSLVECIHDGGWFDDKTGQPVSGPRGGDICTICGFFEGYLVFYEYPGIDQNGEPEAFHPRHFREIQPPITVQIEELISETQTI